MGCQKDMGLVYIGSILAVLVIASTRKYFLKKTKEGI
jgi:hypothetical protein